MCLAGTKKKQNFITQYSELPSSYTTEDGVLKEISYYPSLVPMGLEEGKEDFCFGSAEDTKAEDEQKL